MHLNAADAELCMDIHAFCFYQLQQWLLMRPFPDKICTLQDWALESDWDSAGYVFQNPELKNHKLLAALSTDSQN